MRPVTAAVTASNASVMSSTVGKVEIEHLQTKIDLR